MKLSVACTFEEGFIQKLAKYPEVKEVFGKLTKDIIGGGRSSYLIGKITKTELVNTIKEVHKNNITFNYLLNGANLNNFEHNKSGYKKIRALLDSLIDINIDSVTITSPFLFKLIKDQYPQLKIKVSAFAMVNSIEKAKQWEDLGADEICISAIACNRNFKLLSNIRNAVKCGLQLIANANCMLDCIYEQTHMNIMTNSSRTRDNNRGFYLDYCFFNCSFKRLKNPVNYIKSTWIRPEDLKYYESIGYDSFKILERNSPVDLLIKRVDAYSKRSFNGNLLELISPVTRIKKEQKASFFSRLNFFLYFFKPFKIKLKYILVLKKFLDRIILNDFSDNNAKIYIDNKSLDSFLPDIIKKECNSKNCDDCKYCHNVAKDVVKIDKSYLSFMLDLSEKINKALVNGNYWV